jgi:hypothetical protein
VTRAAPGHGRASRFRSRGIAAFVALVMAVAAPAPAAAMSASNDPPIIVTGHVAMSPLLVALDVSPWQARAGTALQARVIVSNAGPVTVRGIRVRLRFDPTAFIVAPNAARSIAQVKPGGAASVAWQLCGRRPGSYVILAEVSFGGVAIESPARIVMVLPAAKRTC